jgi:hypothetical protein
MIRMNGGGWGVGTDWKAPRWGWGASAWQTGVSRSGQDDARNLRFVYSVGLSRASICPSICLSIYLSCRSYPHEWCPFYPPARRPGAPLLHVPPQHMVRLLSVDCPAARLVGRSDVCLAMAAEGDALLLREPVAFAPQPYALPGAAPAGGGATTSASDLVAFLMSLRTQVPPGRGGGREGGARGSLLSRMYGSKEGGG